MLKDLLHAVVNNPSLTVYFEDLLLPQYPSNLYPVIDEEPAADFRGRVNLDTGQETVRLGYNAWDERYPDPPQEMRYSVQRDCLKSGIGNNFQIACRRIVAIAGSNVFQ